jgi:UDP-glucose 4-epimerase
LGLNLASELTRRQAPWASFSRRGRPREPRTEFSGIESTSSFVSGDLRDREATSRFVRDAETVVFLVSHLVPSSSLDEVSEVLSWLPSSFARLLDACSSGNCRHFVLFSSGGVIYGESPERTPNREDRVPNPRCAYGVLCLFLEKLLIAHQQQHDLDYTIVRAANVYGRERDLNAGQGLIENLMRRLHHGEPIRVIGDGSEVRDYLAIADAAACLADVATSSATNTVYNVGSGIGVTTSSVIELVRLVCDRPTPEITYETRRSCDLAYSVLDPSKFTRVFGRSCSTSLSEGVREYHDRNWSGLPADRAGEPSCAS